MQEEFEIEPGIILSKLDLKEDDTIVVTIDPAQINLDDSYNVWLMMKKNFPLHNILTTFKEVDITIGDKE